MFCRARALVASPGSTIVFSNYHISNYETQTENNRGANLLISNSYYRATY
jgi:hypothetical protein